MSNLLYKILSICTILILSFSALKATHMNGLDIGYEQIGPNRLKLKVRFVRDCSGVSMPAFVNINVSIIGGQSGGDLIQLDSAGPTRKTYGICQQLSNCIVTAARSLEYRDYEAIYDIPLAYQGTPLLFGASDCCTSPFAVNVFTAGDRPIYVECKYLPNALPSQFSNSTPHFLSQLKLLVKAGEATTLQLPHFDIDGDSLVYSLEEAKESTNQPMVYIAPMTYLQPLPANTFSFNTRTGRYTIAANAPIGEYYIFWECKEYRNGTLIGTSQYSRQIKVEGVRNLTQNATIVSRNYLSSNYNTFDNTSEFLERLGDTTSREIGFRIKPCANDDLSFNILIRNAQNYSFESNLDSIFPGAYFNAIPVGNALDEVWLSINIPDAGNTFERFYIHGTSNSCPYQSSLILDFYVTPRLGNKTIVSNTNFICVGASNPISLSAGVANPTSRYTWRPSNLFNGGNSVNNTIIISQPTSVNVSVENDMGFCAFVDTLDIIAVPNNLNITQLDFCGGNPIRFRAGDAPMNGIYRWSPANLFASQNTQIGTANITQATPIGVTYTDIMGCTTSGSMLSANLPINSISVTASDSLVCPRDVISIAARMSGDSSSNIGGPDVYSVSPISYQPLSTNGFIPLSLTDDQSVSITIGFPFVFFGNTVTTCDISSNGYIAPGGGGTAAPYSSSFPNSNISTNIIALALADLNPSLGGRISYSTLGVAPNRKFVVSYDSIRYFNVTVPSVSGQIVLYEGSNDIDIISISITQHGTRVSTQGIQENGQPNGYTVPGRNAAFWSASNSAYRFTNIPDNGYRYFWSNLPSGGISNSANNSFSITNSSTYTVTASNSQGCYVTGSVSVNTRPRGSNLSVSNMYCGFNNGAAVLTGAVSQRWSNNSVSQTVIGLREGTYSVTATETSGCITIDNFRIVDSLRLISGIMSPSVTIPNRCSPVQATFTATSITFGNNYSWSPAHLFGNQTGNVATALLTGPTVVTVSYRLTGGCSVTRSITTYNGNNDLVVTTTTSNACPGTSVTLNALRSGDNGIFMGGIYSIDSIPFQPIAPTTPINCSLTSGNFDEGFSLVNLGFTFNYFGQAYSRAYIGTNGYLSFGSGSSSWAGGTIPGPSSPSNSIFLVGSDLRATSSSMRYEILGTAPNRRFILYFSNGDVNLGIPQEGQIILHENGSLIDIISINIDNLGNPFIQGIENTYGTYALSTPGRNYTATVARNDAYRFTPRLDTISTLGYRYRWSGLTPGSINYLNNVTTTVNSNATYTVTSYDPQGCATTGTVTVNTIPRQSSLVSTPETCGGQDGTATISGGTAYVWSNGSNSSTVTGLSSGFTYVTITEPNGCVILDSVFVGSSLGASWSISTTNANCQATDGTAMASPPSSGGPFTVNWSNGDTGNSVSGLAPGWYSATISNNSGCRSHSNFEIRENSNCFWRIEGHVYNDHVTPDCTTDASSNNISNAIVQVSDNSGNAIGYAVTDSTGFYTYDVRNAGRSYNLDYIVPSYANAIAACPNTLTVSITASQRVSTGNNFYVDFIESSDAEAVAYLPRMRTGINNPFTPFVQNVGNTPLNGTFTLTYSANLTYTGPQNGVIVNTNNRSITWPFSNLHVGSSQSFSSLFSPLLSATAGAPFSLTGIVQINGADTNPANDSFRVDGVIVNSYDPNEKSVFPQGSGPEHGILESQRKLTYTIDFENLGNDTAYAVLIHDVIDTTKLDIRSVRPIASSHDFEMGIKGLDTLTFHFQDINLLARSQDPQRNKGFVAFSIDLKPSLPVGTRIENRASIFFDYNAAIVTNAAFNTIVRPSGIEAPALSLSAKLFPNPTNANATLEIDLEEGTELRIVVLDMMGRAVGNSQQITWLPEGRHQFALDSEQWPAGMYFVQLVTPKGVVALPMQVVR